MRAYPSAAFPGLDETLKVFDPSIESLAIEDSGRAFTLKFLGREPMTLSREGLSEVLSSGTEQGLRLVRCATEILRCGGYLLIDEIENHLNRQLVNVLLDLFDSHSTNPHGATLVFTTHYSQLLDHVHRKDNVYFLAKSDPGFSRIVKYGDVVSRIENKKSEVFSSNYIKGTAPRYADVKALTSVIESQVRANG
jgi:AAA15 family ATPase/GTPase